MNLFDTARALELPPTHIADGAWDRAQKRHERRRAMQAVAATVSAAVAVGVYLTATSSGDGHPAPTATPPHLACTHVQDPLKLPLPSEDKLPAGATAALLCPTNGARWQTPSEPLRRDLDQLVALINSQPEAVLGLGHCLGDNPQADYSIAFAYADGLTLAVWGDAGCTDLLRTGGKPRSGGGMVLAAYLESLVTQRAEHTPPRSSAARCPQKDGGLLRSILPSTPHLDISHASVCNYRWTKVGPAVYAFVLESSTRLPTSGVARLNEAFEANARVTEPDYEVGDRLHTITAVTSWGDQISLELLNGELVLGPAPGQRNSESLGWRISPADRAFLFGE